MVAAAKQPINQSECCLGECAFTLALSLALSLHDANYRLYVDRQHIHTLHLYAYAFNVLYIQTGNYNALSDKVDEPNVSATANATVFRTLAAARGAL